MHPAVVVDVGNSFIKWGRCADGQVVERAFLPPDQSETWQRQLDAWSLTLPHAWAVAAVHPQRCDTLIGWLRQRGHTVCLFDRAALLPLRVDVEHPDRVGIDRLLDAVAANARRRLRCSAVVIDAGSAVTVDWLDAAGSFTGGVIFPGLRLMARSLHDHTALLPLIEVNRCPSLPAKSTPEAMEAGVLLAVAGGIYSAIDALRRAAALSPTDDSLDIFFTGGDAAKLDAPLQALLPDVLVRRLQVVPLLTLEGLRLAAEAQP